MPLAIDRSRMSVEELADSFRGQMIPLNEAFSYFATPPMPDEDLRQYVHETVAAVPPRLLGLIPHVNIVLVPYLSRGKGQQGDQVSFERPAHMLVARRVDSGRYITLFFAIKEEDVSEYHYAFYNAIAALLAENSTDEVREAFSQLVRDELLAKVHGEVDQKSWALKQTWLARPQGKETKYFRDYVKQALEDTLTLYLHGICCDIDVETGPRQMPSRHLRRRLEALYALFPPPPGHAVFPEHVKRRLSKRGS